MDMCMHVIAGGDARIAKATQDKIRCTSREVSPFTCVLQLNKWVERGKEAEAAKDIAPLAPPKQLAGAFPAPASR